MLSRNITRAASRMVAQNPQNVRRMFSVGQAQCRNIWAAAALNNSRRWTAEAAKEQSEQKAETPAADAATADLQKQLAEKTKLADDFKDKYLRALAEAQNLDNRRNREVSEARQHALFKFAGDLVSNLDMLMLAQRNVPGSIADPAHPDHSYYTGVSMVYSNLLKTLKQHNVIPVEIAENGETEFNAHLHDCVAHVPHPTIGKNKIIEVHRPGWKLNDRVVRAATVVVSSGPPPQ